MRRQASMHRVYVTKIIPRTNEDALQERIAIHKTADIRRIVRKYVHDWDCYERKTGVYHNILAPNNGADWRLLIGFS